MIAGCRMNEKRFEFCKQNNYERSLLPSSSSSSPNVDFSFWEHFVVLICKRRKRMLSNCSFSFALSRPFYVFWPSAARSVWKMDHPLLSKCHSWKRATMMFQTWPIFYPPNLVNFEKLSLPCAHFHLREDFVPFSNLKDV